MSFILLKRGDDVQPIQLPPELLPNSQHPNEKLVVHGFRSFMDLTAGLDTTLVMVIPTTGSGNISLRSFDPNLNFTKPSVFCGLSGIITIQFRNDVFVDISLDRSIRIYQRGQGVAASIGVSNRAATCVNPVGRLVHFRHLAEAVVNIDNRVHKIKVNGSSIHFFQGSTTATDPTDIRSYVFPEEAGNKDFSVVDPNYNKLTFFRGVRQRTVEMAGRAVATANSWSDNGKLYFEIFNTVVTQDESDKVEVSRDSGECRIELDPVNKFIHVTTPYMDATGDPTEFNGEITLERNWEVNGPWDDNTFVVKSYPLNVNNLTSDTPQ